MYRVTTLVHDKIVAGRSTGEGKLKLPLQGSITLLELYWLCRTVEFLKIEIFAINVASRVLVRYTSDAVDTLWQTGVDDRV